MASLRLALKGEGGNVLFYIFLAVGLLAALTYAFVKDSRENYASQSAVSIAESLAVQANTIRSAVQQCVMEFPQGGGDMNADGVIDTNDNWNNPYPLNPGNVLVAKQIAGCTTTSSAAGCVNAAGNDYARNLTCVGAPIGQVNMFQGTSNAGLLLPPPPSGFPEWTYFNNTDGVYLRTTAPADAASVNAINRLMTKFATCQADLNYGGCGAACITIWITRGSDMFNVLPVPVSLM